MNFAILAGRLGSDPEIRYTPSGQAVANFSLAIDESYKGKDGTKVNKVLWLRCVAWAQTAETLSKYVHKGDQIMVNGRIQVRDYEASDGSGKRYITEIVVMRFEFGAKKGAGAAQADDSHERGDSTGGGGEAAPPVDDSDIPFVSWFDTDANRKFRI